MKKLDLKKKYKQYYNPSAKEVSVVKIPPFNFIMMDGTIPANTRVEDAPDYQGALETLYGLAYTIKFMCKLRKQDPVDFAVMPLEGLWWFKNSDKTFRVSRDDDWYFTAMIMQPEAVTKAVFAKARRQLGAKKNPARLAEARFESFAEGLSLQIMHLGPYSAEPATIQRMIAYANATGYVAQGKHHEIYLSDPRRTKPEKLRTVLRHPHKKG